MQCLEASVNVDADEQVLQAGEAYTLPEEFQIDSHYHRFSEALVGELFPLQEEDEDEMPNRFLIGSSTLGLSCQVRRDDDKMFSTMQNADNSSDLCNAIVPFSSINDFLEVSDLAWAEHYDQMFTG